MMTLPVDPTIVKPAFERAFFVLAESEMHVVISQFLTGFFFVKFSLQGSQVLDKFLLDKP